VEFFERPRGHLFAAVLQMFILINGGCGQCSQCSHPGNKAMIHPLAASNYVQEYSLPSNLDAAGIGMSSTPLVFKLLVDPDGRPCSVSTVGNYDRSVSSALKGAISRWRFRAPVYNGRRLCLETRLYVYAKVVDGRVSFLIPGLTDRNGRAATK